MLDEKLKSLSSKVWRTEKSRFTAAERVRKKHRAFVFAISFLSIFQVVIAITSICGFYIPLIGESKTEYIVILSSVLVLVIANQDSLSILLRHSASYHQCANQLHRLQQEIEIEIAYDNITKEIALELSKRYDDILESHDLNHLPIDHSKMKTEYPDDFKMSPRERSGHVFRYYRDIYAFPLVYCITPFVIVALAKGLA